MSNEGIAFSKEKVAVMEKISKDVLSEIEQDALYTQDDFINDVLSIRLSGVIYSNLADERDLEYYFKPPTFLDWLFRRKRKATFNLKVKDLLLNAPKPEDSMRIYVVED